MRSLIHPLNKQGAEFSTAERCYIREIFGVSTGDAAASLAVARVEPGITTALHALEGVEERYVIQSGRGRMEVGGLPPAEVGPGDAVLIPAGTRQRIANMGKEDLIFLCICTPAFTRECYRDLEGAG